MKLRACFNQNRPNQRGKKKRERKNLPRSRLERLFLLSIQWGLRRQHQNHPDLPREKSHPRDDTRGIKLFGVIQSLPTTPCLGFSFWTPRCGFRIRVSGTWILDSNCKGDSGFLELYFGFQNPGFRSPQAIIFHVLRNPDYFTCSDIQALKTVEPADSLKPAVKSNPHHWCQQQKE